MNQRQRVPPSADAGERALEGAPAAVVVVGHPAAFDGNGDGQITAASAFFYTSKKGERD